jgi:hypothetical protein
VLFQCGNDWHDQAAGVTNYVTLLDRLNMWRSERREPICLVTFNYDTMIELALKVFGRTFADLDSYIDDDAFPLLKVHGSVDWVHPAEYPKGTPADTSQAVAEALSATIRADYLKLNRTPTGIDYPALAVPLISKGALLCPDSHLAVLKESLQSIDRALIVGWRGAEKHFLNLWRDLGGELKTLAIVTDSHDNAAATNANLHSEGVVSRNVDMIDSGFTGLLDADAFEQFLRH